MDENQQVKHRAGVRSDRRWLRGAGYAAVVLALLFGFRYWREWQMNQPVYEEYANYMNAYAQKSLKAQEYLQRYYRVHQRETVASRDFPVVCGNITVLAETDGVHIDPDWAAMAQGCRKAVQARTLGQMP